MTNVYKCLVNPIIYDGDILYIQRGHDCMRVIIYDTYFYHFSNERKKS